MTTSEQPTGGAAGAAAPTNPTAPTSVPPPVPGVPTSTPAGDAPAFPAPDAPFVPAPVIQQPAPVDPVAFDARALVDSQKKGNSEPVYGGMPKPSTGSAEASRKLRDEARKKRNRNRRVARTLLVVVVAAVGTGGYFAWAEFQRNDGSDTDVAVGETLAEELFPQVVDDADGPDSPTPLGEQVEVLEGMEPLNDAAVPSAGGLGGAIADARDVVAQLDGDEAASAGPAPPLALDVVLPAWVRANGARLPDATGREVHSFDASDFAAGAPDEYRAFVRTLSALPQRSPGHEAFDGFPSANGDEIVVAVDRDDADVLTRLVVRSSQPAIHVAHTP